MQISLNEAILKLQAGEVVAIPTETVYGLAADATNDAALHQIYAIKQRPADNPLIVHIADISQVADWANEFSPLAQKLAQAFWPGPFTLVLPAKSSVSHIVRANEPTVALRVPSHPLTLVLLQQSGLSLAAPSANKYTQLSPTTAAHVTMGLGDELAVLDGGACQVGIESTIVSVAGDDWQLLRFGMITEAEIEQVAGKPALKSTLPNQQNQPKVPGQHLLHYSPRTPLSVYQTRAELLAESLKCQTQHIPHAALLFGAGALPACEYLTLANHANQAAEALYGALHELDSLNVTRLLVEKPPATPEWLGVLDRVSRASH